MNKMKLLIANTMWIKELSCMNISFLSRGEDVEVGFPHATGEALHLLREG